MIIDVNYHTIKQMFLDPDLFYSTIAKQYRKRSDAFKSYPKDETFIVTYKGKKYRVNKILGLNLSGDLRYNKNTYIKAKNLIKRDAYESNVLASRVRTVGGIAFGHL